MRLAIFDLDAALARETCDVLWSRYLQARGEIDDARLERCAWVARQYRAGTVVPEDYALAQAALIAGRRFEELAPLCARFVDEALRPHLSPAVEDLLRQHRAQGETLLLTSVSCEVLLGPIAHALEVDAVLGTEIVCFAGRCTGMLHGHPNMRAYKLERVRQWLHARQQGEATLRRASFHSNSINDLALLSAVGRPVVIDPDPRLAATAMRKGWRLLQLEPPRSGQRQLPLDPVPA
ncbi:MAG TPA: HAD-IB family hydrolase [Rubrivivax sp.]|nr:HAD-IB family hydrolase [Burkholderiales bacterium]HNT39870.1 HAD-IB family hydrolase [Rubrivivax sp.]